MQVGVAVEARPAVPEEVELEGLDPGRAGRRLVVVQLATGVVRHAVAALTELEAVVDVVEVHRQIGGEAADLLEHGTG